MTITNPIRATGAAPTTAVPSTGAVTASAPSTSSFDVGAVATQIFTDEGVIGSIAGAISNVTQAGINALGGNTGKTPQQIAAEAAAAKAKADAERTQMLIIGGGIALVVVILGVMFVRGRK